MQNQCVQILRKATRQKGDGLEIDLLLAHDGQEYHYILILDLLRLGTMVKRTTTLDQRVLCKKLIPHLHERKHIQSASNEPAVVEMPKPENNKLEFKKLGARWFAPVVIYFDLESKSRPVSGCENVNQQTNITEFHQSCGFCVVGIEHGNFNPIFVQLERSEDCMEKFVEELETIAKEIHQKIQRNRYFRDTVPVRPKETEICWICESQFGKVRELEDDKVISHCHYSGKFLGFAHPECNIKAKTINFLPVMALNLTNYELHHMCLYIHKFESACKNHVIPSTDEKYITLTIGLPVRNYQDKNELKKTNF